jgi:hypothetical protein
MTGSGDEPRATRPGQKPGTASRAEKLDAALRENLKRRKQQARARSNSGGQDDNKRQDG